jgi:hypothetical protein
MAFMTSSVPASSEWQTFVHPKWGFSLSYPAEWHVVKSSLTGDRNWDDGGELAVLLAGPQIAGVDRRVYLIVDVDTGIAPKGMTLEELAAANEPLLYAAN